MSVNRKKRGRPNRGDDNLTSEGIVDAAKTWMLQEKKLLSVRGLAKQLDVDPMAIYYYFENKAALMEAVLVAVMDDIYTPHSNHAHWETELEQLCESYLHLLIDHPGLLETLLSTASTGLAHVEVFAVRFDIATAPLALDAKKREAALHLLVDYLHGFALAVHTAKGEEKPATSDMKKPFKLYLQALESTSGA